MNIEYFTKKEADDNNTDKDVMISIIGANAVSIILTSLINIEIIHKDIIIILVSKAVCNSK